MRVLLVNPSSIAEKRAGPYSKTMLPAPPVGMAYLAAVARSLGHAVTVEDQYASGIDAGAVSDMVSSRRSELVGIGCLSPNMPAVEAMVRRIKSVSPSVHIVLGNLHASLFARELLERLPIDSIVMGEGEETFAELLGVVGSGGGLGGIRGLAFREGGSVAIGPARPPIRDLDRLPRPAWDLFRLHDYHCPPRLLLKGRILPVQSARGCAWNCTFCSQNTFMPGVRRRSLVRVVDEIEWLHQRFGVTNFGFQDALFPPGEEEGLKFCRLMEERGLHRTMRWFTQTRCDRVTRRLLGEMKRCGCRLVMYGFESGCNRHLKASGKGFTVDQALAAARMMRELRFHAYGLFMIGFPHETLAEAHRTIAFAKRLDCILCSFARVTPYPGSALYERYKDSFPESVFPWQWNSQYRRQPHEPDWQLPGLSSAQIQELLREAMISYYLRPGLVLRHLRHGVLSPLEMLQGGVSLLRDILRTQW